MRSGGGRDGDIGEDLTPPETEAKEGFGVGTVVAVFVGGAPFEMTETAPEGSAGMEERSAAEAGDGVASFWECEGGVLDGDASADADRRRFTRDKSQHRQASRRR